MHSITHLFTFILMINLSQNTQSKILLIWHAKDQTSAGLLDITDYNTVPIMT